MNAINAKNASNQKNAKYFLITIDVEDWFQVENLKPWIPFSSWDSRELRVEQNVHRLLDLFDSIKLPQVNNPYHNLQLTTNNIQTKKVKATFFVLGWLAERLPHLIRAVQSRGHEIASHGYNHELPEKMTLDNFRQDCGDSKKHLEDIIGSSVCGYRAPSFSINDYVLNSIKEAGYLYDSSYNSFALQGRYGKISLNGNSINGIAHRMSNGLYELPISNLHLKFATNNNQLTTFTRRSRGFVVPFGGGAYFRLIPFYIFKHGAGKILKKQNAYVFYLHPWELDPKQQRVSQASSSRKFRHYTNLHLTEKKLRKLIDNFGNCQFVTATDYLNAVSTSGTC